MVLALPGLARPALTEQPLCGLPYNPAPGSTYSTPYYRHGAPHRSIRAH